MNNLLLIFTLFVSGIVYSQSGQVIYKISMPDNFEESLPDTQSLNSSIAKQIIEETYNKIKRVSKIVEINLDFNNDTSKSTVTRGMGIGDDNDFEHNLSGLFHNGTYWIDIDEGTSEFHTKEGRDIIRIQRRIKDIEWEINGNTKMIQGFLCTEATAKYSFNFLTNTEIKAWFTNILPSSIAPLGITGLPGAILELELINTKQKYFATDIKVNKQEKIIKKPTKGILHDFDSYKDYLIDSNPLNEKFRD